MDIPCKLVGRRNKTEQLEAYKDEVTALAFELSAQDARHKALMVSGRTLVEPCHASMVTASARDQVVSRWSHSLAGAL